MTEFTGNPAPLTDADFERAARAIGCTVAAVRAVNEVESRGGFFADRRPKILYERHIFSRLTKRKFDAANPAIANPSPGGYIGGPAEYDRLAKAIALDRNAALQSASWGAFQIMGFNHKAAGFADVEAFVKAMASGQGAQLDAFVKFIKTNSLDDELIRRDWSGFARGYNGPEFAKNKYDIKLAAAFTLHNNGGPRTENPRPVLRMGDRGEDVKILQTALKITADGDFGPGTKAAVIKAQKAAKLYPDGVVGQQTWKAILK
jgi:hypothetical protein